MRSRKPFGNWVIGGAVVVGFAVAAGALVLRQHDDPVETGNATADLSKRPRESAERPSPSADLEVAEELRLAREAIARLEEENADLRTAVDSVDAMENEILRLNRELLDAHERFHQGKRLLEEALAATGRTDELPSLEELLRALGKVAAEPAAKQKHPRPGSIASSGIPVHADTTLEVGQSLQVKYGSTWWAAEIVSLEDDGWVGIHYTGWEDSWDEVVPREHLQLSAEE